MDGGSGNSNSQISIPKGPEIEDSLHHLKNLGDQLWEDCRDVSRTGEVRGVLDRSFIENYVFNDANFSKFVVRNLPNPTELIDQLAVLDLPENFLAVNLGSGWGNDTRNLLRDPRMRPRMVIDLELEPTVSVYDNDENRASGFSGRTRSLVGDLRSTPFPNHKSENGPLVHLVFSSGVGRYQVPSKLGGVEELDRRMSDSLSIVRSGGYTVHMEMGDAAKTFFFRGKDCGGGFNTVLKNRGYQAAPQSKHLEKGEYSVKKLVVSNLPRFTRWYLLYAITSGDHNLNLPPDTDSNNLNEIEELVQNLRSLVKEELRRNGKNLDFSSSNPDYLKLLLEIAGSEDKESYIVTARKH